MQGKVTIAAGLLALSGYGAYTYFRHVPKLREGDVVLLTDFNNSTKEPVFDGALRDALSVSLSQSPFFNVVSSEKTAEALKASGLGGERTVTRELAPKLCASTQAKAFVTGTVSSDGGKYLVSLEVLSCGTGASLGKTEAEAANARQVLHALGVSATEL